jgi:hypothetical protein
MRLSIWAAFDQACAAIRHQQSRDKLRDLIAKRIILLQRSEKGCARGGFAEGRNVSIVFRWAEGRGYLPAI